MQMIVEASIPAGAAIIIFLLGQHSRRRRQKEEDAVGALANRRDAYHAFEAAAGRALAQLNFAGAYRHSRVMPWAVTNDVVARMTTVTAELTGARSRLALVGVPDNILDVADALLEVLANVGSHLARSSPTEHEALLGRYRDARIAFEHAAAADAGQRQVRASFIRTGNAGDV